MAETVIAECHGLLPAVGAIVTDMGGGRLPSLLLTGSTVEVLRFVARHDARIVRIDGRRVFDILDQ